MLLIRDFNGHFDRGFGFSFVPLKSKQAGVNTALPLQLIVTAAFHNSSLVDNIDAVGPLDSRKPVSDDNRRPCSDELVDCLLHLAL